MWNLIKNKTRKEFRYLSGLSGNKRRHLIYFLVLISSVQTFGQPSSWLWAKSVGGTDNDYVRTIALDAWGNVYTTGWFRGTVDFDPDSSVHFNLASAGLDDIFISKLDGYGNLVWAKRMGGTNLDLGNSLSLDALGNVYTTGIFIGTVDFDPGAGIFNLTPPNGNRDIFVSKLDSSGNFVWAKRIGGTNIEESISIAIDASGNVYTTGTFAGTADFDPGPAIFNLTGPGVFISKLDASGNFVWAKVMNGPGIGFSIALDTAGGGDVVTTGYFFGTVDFDPGTGTFNLFSAGGSYDIFISKVDSSGNFVWAKRIGGTTNWDDGTSITIDPSGSGHVYTTGRFSGTVDFDPGAGVFNLTSASTIYSDIFISKLDSSGNFVWAKRMGGIYEETGRSIVIDPAGSGEVYIAGDFGGTVDFDPGAGTFNLSSSGTSFDVFISKLDSLGNFVWAKGLGGIYNDLGLSLALDASGHVHITGDFSSTSIAFGTTTLTNANTVCCPSDIFIAKLDTVTTITGSKEIENSVNNILVFPNPATSEVIINFEKASSHEVQLYNTLGEILFQTTTDTTQIKIDVRNIPQGIYFIFLRNGVNKYLRKLIILRS